MEPQPSQARTFPNLKDFIWRAPLVPVAFALTLGILLDRHLDLPFYFSLAAILTGFLSWLAHLRGPTQGLAPIYLWIACVGMGSAYHHFMRAGIADNDIRHLASEDAKPAHLKGVVESEPNYVRGGEESPFYSFPKMASTRFVLNISHLKTIVDWLPVTGSAQVLLQAKVNSLHVGDRVEIVGRMTLPSAPANPGEFDYASFLRDQGIGVVVAIPPSTEGIYLLEKSWPNSLNGWLTVVRGWGQDAMAQYLPENVSGIAGALILGEGSSMTGDDWEKYVRTGVIHVLAISGQQLVILGCFLWGVIRFLGISSRWGSLGIAVFLLLYALMTGGRPPVMRSAWVMVACCGGMWLQRMTLPANTFALGWIGVVIANPTNIFNVGCQLSFLAVAILFWGTKSSAYSSAFLVWVPFMPKSKEFDLNLQKLIDDSRPPVLRYLVRLERWVFDFYLVNATVWLAVTPLVAGTQNVISPIALLIGPPLVLLTSIALISGFMMLLATPFGLAPLFSWLVHGSLAGCELLVDNGLLLPGAYLFVPSLPSWWLWLFYILLFAYLTVPWVHHRPLPFIVLFAIWISLGFLILLGTFRNISFHCTFLAVGHGGCTLLVTLLGNRRMTPDNLVFIRGNNENCLFLCKIFHRRTNQGQ